MFPYADAEALAAALAALIADPARRRTMGAAGRARVLAEYTLDSYVAGVTRVFDEVLSWMALLLTWLCWPWLAWRARAARAPPGAPHPADSNRQDWRHAVRHASGAALRPIRTPS